MSDRTARSTIVTMFLPGALVVIPIIIYLFASLTSIGPVLFTFPQFPDAGVHVGDAVFAVAMAPVWCVVLLRLLSPFGRRTS